LSEFWEGDVAPNEEPQEEGATFRRLDRDQNGSLDGQGMILASFWGHLFHAIVFMVDVKR
jgi:hypothetical protein